MIRKAFISSGVAYHHGMVQPGAPLDDFEVLDLGRLEHYDLNDYDLVFVPRSSDGEVLRARRYQFARFLDNGGVLIALGELWANWFPGCCWREECHEDTLEPIISANHQIIDTFSPPDLHWHPSKTRWCCHGHFDAPASAEVLVRNARGDAWLYVDRTSSNGVIVASSNLDPDTHTFHGSKVARSFFEQLLSWAEDEATHAAERRERLSPKLAGLYSGVHFQRAFYDDPEFAPQYAVLPVWELAATDLRRYAALWIPRESNQHELVSNRDKLVRYLNDGGIIISFEEANQPWLPAGEWSLSKVHIDTVRVADHPVVAGLTAAEVGWHSHGAYTAYPNAEILVDDAQGGVMLFLDERSFNGKLLAGTMDPDCHAGFGTETTRPLLRTILAWVNQQSRIEELALA